MGRRIAIQLAFRNRGRRPHMGSRLSTSVKERQMFVGRKEDGSIYGLWAVRQWDGQEELPDDDADVVAFRARVPAPKTASAGDFMRALYELGWYEDVSAAVAAYNAVVASGRVQTL